MSKRRYFDEETDVEEMVVDKLCSMVRSSSIMDNLSDITVEKYSLLDSNQNDTVEQIVENGDDDNVDDYDEPVAKKRKLTDQLPQIVECDEDENEIKDAIVQSILECILDLISY